MCTKRNHLLLLLFNIFDDAEFPSIGVVANVIATDGMWCVSSQQADKAISSIKPMHVQEVKKLPNPADVIKMVFDCILLLFHSQVRGLGHRYRSVCSSHASLSAVMLWQLCLPSVPTLRAS